MEGERGIGDTDLINNIQNKQNAVDIELNEQNTEDI